MDKNKDYGQLMPKVVYQNGELQYLCRLIPTPWDYICKRYLPFKYAKKHADKFMLKFTGYNTIMNVPILSGCFMFLRVSALKEIGLFDERFFMYPEDDDLTRRMHMKYKTIYYPYLQVCHGYEAAPYKSLKMHFILLYNMVKYFNKWGWLFDKNRREINKKVLMELDYKN
ncbi:glycosyltransferase, group 2 family domain protein [Bacteroides fragilis str. S6L5]|nr:glycosyltransferase, group 2 family domain protein [Bacteroides fragilis str. S6L5]